MTSSTASPAAKRNPWLLISYASIVGLWGISQVILIPYVIHVLVLTTSILYAGCHASLVLRQEKDPNAQDEDDNVSSSDKEVMRSEDAYQFPLVGSLSLFGLYLAFKFFDKQTVNLVLGLYFAVAGCLALTLTLSPGVSQLSPIAWRRNIHAERRIPHPLPAKWLENPVVLELDFTANDALAFVVAVVTCCIYFQSKPWYLNNVLGISFCLQGISKFSLGTYKIGAILLIGLFFYDIFWVFGTEVMVSVAKSLEGPIKLLFPRTLTRNVETGLLDLSLLGLGDIVIPGFFLALLLRFDAHRADEPCIGVTHYHADFHKPYFHTALASYVAGLGLTMFIMLQFNAAQPALLYLVPACLLSSLGLAVWRGEVKELLAYSEEEVEEQDEAVAADATKAEESKKTD
jgi:minor histocompatibility antigen H13